MFVANVFSKTILLKTFRKSFFPNVSARKNPAMMIVITAYKLKCWLFIFGWRGYSQRCSFGCLFALVRGVGWRGQARFSCEFLHCIWWFSPDACMNLMLPCVPLACAHALDGRLFDSHLRSTFVMLGYMIFILHPCMILMPRFMICHCISAGLRGVAQGKLIYTSLRKYLRWGVGVSNNFGQIIFWILMFYNNPPCLEIIFVACW